MIVTEVIAAMNVLLDTNSSEFLRSGRELWASLAIIMIAWHGIMWMYSGAPFNQKAGELVAFVIFLAISGAMINNYAVPIFGLGMSFRELATGMGTWAMRTLNTDVMDRLQQQYDDVLLRIQTPGIFAVWTGMAYISVWCSILLGKVVAWALVIAPMIALAVVTLFGPLFVPFLIFPPLSFLFWSWLKAVFAFSFFPAVAIGFLFVQVTALQRILLMMPDTLTVSMYPTWVFTYVAISLMFTFASALMVPWIAHSMFSGSGHAGFNLASAITRLF